MTTYFYVNTTLFNIVEKLMQYGPISPDQLARCLNVDISPTKCKFTTIRVAETYEPTKYWDFDFRSQTITSSTGIQRWNADPLQEALIRFYKSAGSRAAFMEEYKELINVDGGYIDVDTLKPVWPVPGRPSDHLLFSNGLAMSN